MRSVPCVRSALVLVAVVSGAGWGATSALAQDGAYVVEPWRGGYRSVKVQPADQKIVVTGSMQVDPETTNEYRMLIARYDHLGNRDAAFGVGGPSIPPMSGVSVPALGPDGEGGQDLVLQPDGKLVVSGLRSPPLAGFAVARFQSNGTLDGAFGSGGWNFLDVGSVGYNPAFGVGLQSTGKVVLAGLPLRIGNSFHPAEVARFTAAGILDSGKGAFGQVEKGKSVGYSLDTFGMIHNSFYDLAVQPDDKLVAVGQAYTDATTNRRLIVARYTGTGKLDTTFNGNGYVSFLPPGLSQAAGWAVALQSNGRIVVAGSCTGIDGDFDLLVARFNANGTIDTSFGGGSGYVRLDVDGIASVTSESALGMVIDPDGRIVAAGAMSSAGNPSNVLVVRLNPNGVPDPTFGGSGFKLGAPLPGTGYHSFEGSGVALQSNGSIIVSGSDDQDETDQFEGFPLLMWFNP